MPSCTQRRRERWYSESCGCRAVHSGAGSAGTLSHVDAELLTAAPGAPHLDGEVVTHRHHGVRVTGVEGRRVHYICVRELTNQ